MQQTANRQFAAGNFSLNFPLNGRECRKTTFKKQAVSDAPPALYFGRLLPESSPEPFQTPDANYTGARHTTQSKLRESARPQTGAVLRMCAAIAPRRAHMAGTPRPKARSLNGSLLCVVWPTAVYYYVFPILLKLCYFNSISSMPPE